MEHNDKIIEILLGMKEDMGSLKADTSGIKDHLEKLNSKVASHESWISNAKGKIAVVSTVVGGITALVVAYVKKQFDG